MKQQTQINKIEWKEVELGNIFEFKEKTGIQAGEGLEEGKYKFFTSSDIQSKFLDKFNFKGEHLVFSTGGKAGLHYCNEPFSVSNDCFTVEVNEHSTKLIFYLLKSKIYLLERGFKGAGLRHLSKNYLIKIKISLPFSNGKPDLKEQERIVKILEKAEKLKEIGKNANKLLDEYLKSIFNEMFYNKGFEEIKLGDKKYFEITMGQSPAGVSYNKIGKGTPFFQGKKEFGEKYPSVEQWTTEPSKLAKPNDILISVRAPVGSINLANIKCCIGRGLASIRCKEEIKMNFVYSFLKVKEKEIENLGNGSTFKAITSGQLLGIKIPLPSSHLQQKFAKIVEHVEKMKENVKKTKQTSEELFNSLMQKAFKGEL